MEMQTMATTPTGGGYSTAATQLRSTPTYTFDDYKLETMFYDSYVVQRTLGRLWEESTWKQEKMIGGGASGRVWLEKKQEGGQLRAVKMIPRYSSPKPRFSQELLPLAKLPRDYDHLFVKFLGWYENKNYIFLAMEYIEYGDLGGYMLRGPRIPIAEVKEITKQVLEGLEVLHMRGICHRDLKPQNILIASQDPIWVKISDFGISKRIEGTIARTVCGTQSYLAPELLGVLPRRSKTRESYHNAVDIWSLGTIVHQLLTFQMPFVILDEESDSEAGESLSEHGIDIGSLVEYCQGDIDFPTTALEVSQVDEKGIAFVKNLLVPSPKARPTAASVLQDPWLGGYTSGWLEDLRNEFAHLGVNMDLESKEKSILVRQAHKADILLLLPASAKEKVPALLYEAAREGYDLAFSKLIQSLSFKSIDCLTKGRLFKLAAKAERLNTIKLLLHNKADVGASINNQSVLQWVAKEGHTKTAILLLNAEADVSTSTNCQEAFQLAIESGHVGVVEVFLSNNISVHIRSKFNNGYTPLQAAAGGGHIDIVGLLLDTKADVNAAAAESRGRTALQAAAERGHIEVVRLLLGKQANVNATMARYGGRTALQAAAEGGYIDTVKLLLENGADVNAAAAESGGLTALQAAAQRGHIEVVRLLLGKKASVNATMARYGGRTALQVAAGGGYIDTVKLLLENGADVNAAAAEYGEVSVNAAAAKGGGKTALQVAAGDGYIDVVRLLLNNEADVNAVAAEYEGRTALQAAAEGGHIDVIKLLIEKKANVNATMARYRGRTALQAAAGRGHIDSIRLLLNNKADVNADAVEFEGRTALQAAAEGGHIDIVKLLLDNDADVNAAAAKGGGRTALQSAAGSGHIDITRLLLVNKADVNGVAAVCQGRTALQAAANGGHIGIVTLLLDNKADVNAAAAEYGGQTTLQAAVEGGCIDTTGVFKAQGSTPRPRTL